MDRRSALKKTAFAIGSAVAIPPLASVLKGCTPAETDLYAPVFLNQDQFKTIAAMTDRILPKTETVGALEVGCDRFIDLMLKECYASKEQQRFLSGLSVLNSNVQDQLFQDLDFEAQENMLTTIDINKEDTDLNFMFKVVKDLTLLGYFTSEQGIKDNFNYLPVPGRYEGCVTLAAGDKPWRGGRL